jgi:tRNA dimethylallyltransferase
MLPPFRNCFLLTGPTASGKTALALKIAPVLHAEIIAMDSMTVYRGMDIGTAKPTPQEQESVPHHLLDIRSITENYSVADWLQDAQRAVEGLQARGKNALFVGGTPFYLKALVHGLFESPPVPAEIRKALEARLAAGAGAELHAELTRCDPPSAARLHPNDGRRVVRALEVYQATGVPLSQHQQQGWFDGVQTEANPRIICLEMERDTLNDRIDRRVLTMLEAGWLEEVHHLMQTDPVWGRVASQAVGYALLRDVLAGKITLQSAITSIQIKTRQFAKHQRTWFRSGGFGFSRPANEVFTAWEQFLK